MSLNLAEEALNAVYKRQFSVGTNFRNTLCSRIENKNKNILN